MPARQTIASLSSLLLLALFSILMHDVAGAQDRWPPWQSYGEAEDNARKRALRRARPTELAVLNRQIAQLKAAGKYDQAVPLAQKALTLAEKKGADSPEVADALDTLASLYEAQHKYAEAEPLLKRSLAIREKSKAPAKTIAEALNNLARLYEKQGRTADAQALEKRAVAVLEKRMDEIKEPQGGPPPGSEAGRSSDAAAKAEAERQAAEAAKKAAEEAQARKAAEEQRAQAEQERAKAAQPAKPDQPLPKYSARRMAPPPAASRNGESAPAPSDDETVSRTSESDASPDEMFPGAGAPASPPAAAPPPAAANGEPPAAAPPPPEDAFEGAPPPVAAAKPSPPPSDGEPAKDILDEKSGGGGMSASPRIEPLGRAGPGAPAPTPTISPTAPAPTTMAPPVPPPPLPSAAAPAGGAAPPAPEPDWHVVPVYWGTDRAVQPNAQRLVFGSDRARKLQLGEALVTVPKVHEVPKVERPWVVTIPYFDVTIYAEKEDPKKHFTVKEIKALTKEELLAQVKARLKDSKTYKDQALVFVHGYNTSFDNALYRTAQIAYDLDFDGAPFLYSWPSGGAVASYTYDRESAQASEPYLREFLEIVVKQTGAKQVSIIAHSMGNQPVMDVLRDMKSSAPEGVTINQVILAAPDVDADSFSNLAKTIKGLAKNVTLYVASNDRALIVSRNFWGSYRAGDVPPAGPLILPGIDTIDVTAASTDTFAINHSGYASNNKLLDDIRELLKTGLRPPEMRPLKPGKITTQAGDYWRYVPPPQ